MNRLPVLPLTVADSVDSILSPGQFFDDLHVVSFQRHTDCAVEADGLAVEHVVFYDCAEPVRS